MSGCSDDTEPRDNGWRIVHSIFTQSANIAGPAFSVNISGVKDSGITITVCWQDEVVTTELMEGVAVDLQRWLEKIAEH